MFVLLYLQFIQLDITRASRELVEVSASLAQLPRQVGMSRSGQQRTRGTGKYLVTLTLIRP